MISTKVFQWFRKLTLLLSQIILIFAFGCGPMATPIIIDVPTPTPRPGQVVQPSATPFVPPGITPIPPTEFVPKAVIKIFSHVPLSGDQAAFGRDILRGTELAIEDLSGPLNEYGYKVELVSYDDQNAVATARANAQQIVADTEILCGVGHYDATVTISASDIYHLASLSIISPSVTAPLLTDRSYREVNRVIGRADGQGVAAAQFAISKQYGSVFIVSPENQDRLLIAEYFRRDSSNLGIQLLGMRVGNVTNVNIEEIIRQIMAANPDLVFTSSTADQVIPLLTGLRAAGYTGTFLGTEELDNPALISQAGASLIEGGGIYLTIMSPPAQYYPTTEQFVWEYKNKYGEEPLDLAARAYDATGMCLLGIEKAIEELGDVVPTRADVTRAIRRLNDYDGLTGTYDFNREGDPDPVQYYVLQLSSVDAANWNQNPIVAAYEIIPP